MAKSLSDRTRLMLGLAAAAACALPTIASAITTGSIPTGPGRLPVRYECDHAQMDYKANLLHLRGNVRIWQGDISVAADDADASGEGRDFKDSRWVFTGKVHVRSESQGDLRADQATVEITGGELASAVVTGSPALFEETHPTAGRLAKGQASSIDYQVAAATVTLTGDAVLNDDHNGEDMRSPSITYNVRTMSLEADGGPGGRARMTLTPRSGPGKKP
jgi:lipopolysaccharide transport protein LptA